MFDYKSKKLTFGQLLRLSADTYKKNFLFIFLCVLVFYLPVFTVMEFMPDEMKTIITTIDLSNINEQVINYAYMLIFIFLLFVPMYIASTAYVTKCHLSDERVSLLGIMEASIFKWWKLFLTAAIYIVAHSFSLTLIIPAIYFGFYLVYCVHITATTPKWGFSACRESRSMLKRRFWTNAGFVVVVLMLSYFVGILFNLLLTLMQIPSIHVLNIGFSIINEVICSFFYIMLAVRFINISNLPRDLSIGA